MSSSNQEKSAMEARQNGLIYRQIAYQLIGIPLEIQRPLFFYSTLFPFFFYSN